MAPRANWKGFLRLSLATCPVALYATYFDGLSTGDQKAKEIHETTRDLLKHFHEEIKALASIEQATDSAAARERQVAIG
jgi:hypothetical protein